MWGKTRTSLKKPDYQGTTAAVRRVAKSVSAVSSAWELVSQQPHQEEVRSPPQERVRRTPDNYRAAAVAKIALIQTSIQVLGMDTEELMTRLRRAGGRLRFAEEEKELDAHRRERSTHQATSRRGRTESPCRVARREWQDRDECAVSGRCSTSTVGTGARRVAPTGCTVSRTAIWR